MAKFQRLKNKKVNPDPSGFAFCDLNFLVAVMLRLVRAFDRHVEVIRLRLGELGQHDANFSQMQAGDFFVELLGHLTSVVNDSTGWSHIQFQIEAGDESQAGRKIDLVAKPRGCVLFIENRRHSQFQSLFPIECKRLPTPKGKDRDEREYVFTKDGTTGGIQRFKFGFHGSTHNFAAMIAYVQERDFAHWLNTVNGWIGDLSKKAESPWSEADSLHSVGDASTADVCVLHSQHARQSGLSLCDLRHLWIKMN